MDRNKILPRFAGDTALSPATPLAWDGMQLKNTRKSTHFAYFRFNSFLQFMEWDRACILAVLEAQS
jgi:hypothetical protein